MLRLPHQLGVESTLPLSEQFQGAIADGVLLIEVREEIHLVFRNSDYKNVKARREKIGENNVCGWLFFFFNYLIINSQRKYWNINCVPRTSRVGKDDNFYLINPILGLNQPEQL